MSALDTRTVTQSPAVEGSIEPMSSRLRRAVPLLVGAALVLLLLKPIGSLPLQGWVPVLIGLSYAASGLLSGRRGVLLPPGSSSRPGASPRSAPCTATPSRACSTSASAPAC